MKPIQEWRRLTLDQHSDELAEALQQMQDRLEEAEAQLRKHEASRRQLIADNERLQATALALSGLLADADVCTLEQITARIDEVLAEQQRERDAAGVVATSTSGPAGGGPYREGAPTFEAPRPPIEVPCVSCGEMVPLGETNVVEEGYRCLRCA